MTSKEVGTHREPEGGKKREEERRCKFGRLGVCAQDGRTLQGWRAPCGWRAGGCQPASLQSN